MSDPATDYFVRTVNNRGNADYACASLSESMDYARLMDVEGKQPILYARGIAFIPIERGFARVEKLDLGAHHQNAIRLETI